MRCPDQLTLNTRLFFKIIAKLCEDPRPAAKLNWNISTLTHLFNFAAPPNMMNLHAQMRFLMSKAKTKSTTKTQQSLLKSWFRYTQFAQIPRMLVGGWHLAAYATSLVV